MTFIVTLIALLIERFFDWSHLRHWHWYTAFQRIVTQKFAGQSPYLVLALTIFPLLIVIGLIDYFFEDAAYGFLKLIFQIVVLLYCLGPQNLWADSFFCINELEKGDAKFAADKLKTLFGRSDTSYSQSLHRYLLNNIFIEANRRIFAVVFWFLLLGPVGAVLYRMVTLSIPEAAKENVSTELSKTGRVVETVLDWLPVRVFTFIFALGGHFVQVFSCWRKKVHQGLSSNEAMLTNCGTAAVCDEDQGRVAEDGSVEKNAVSLLDRTFVIALVIVAIITFAV